MQRETHAMINDNSGFTLTEFLIAIVILMVGLLGMLQGINLAMDKSMENVFRNESLMVADEYMMAKRSRAFEVLSTTTAPVGIISSPRYTRGVYKNYSVVQSVNFISGQDYVNGTKEIVVRVAWSYRNKKYSNTISSFVSKAKE